MTINVKLLTFLILINTCVQADTSEKISIAVMENAKVFAQFDQEIPAVISYFTIHSEIEIISFYSNIYGKPLSNEYKRERLELTFVDSLHHIRMIISQQDNVRQVDILITLVSH